MDGINEIRISNFKAFSSEQVAELAPITLIYGPNSGGKSSLLQSLLLLKQSAMAVMAEMARPHPQYVPFDLVTRGEWVDLGSFQSLVHGHEVENEVSIGLSFERSGMEPVGLRRGASWQQAKVTLSFRLSNEGQRPGYMTPLIPMLTKVSYSLDDLPTLTLVEGIKSLDESFPDGEHGVRQVDPMMLKDDQIPVLIHWIRALPPQPREWMRDPSGASERRPAEVQLAESWLGSFDTETSLDLLSKLHLLCFALGPSGLHCRPNREGGEEDYWVHLEEGEERRPGVEDLALDHLLSGVGANLNSVASRFQELMVSLSHLGPFRSPPARFFVPAAAWARSVGKAGELTPSLLLRSGEPFRQAVNEWLAKLGMGYEVDTLDFSDEIAGELVSITLRNTSSGISVAPSDVGFGVGQLLPVIVEGLKAEHVQFEGAPILVEQPEIHLHPRLQAAVADFFIETALGGNEWCRHQWIIETHSEALMLRIQRRIREGTDKIGVVVRPEDVAVLYVSPGEKGSRIQRLRLDKDGSFIDEWPDGFFVERYDELLGE